MEIFDYIESVPWLSTEQMIEVDRLMIEEFGIELVQMMENAGRNLAELATNRFLDGNPVGKRIAVLAGVGGNGGGAMVCARFLHNKGAHVEVFLTKETSAFSGVPAHQLRILQNMKIKVHSSLSDSQHYDLFIDGVIGYSLKGNPRGGAKDLILWATDQNQAPILSLDMPSGVDGTTGEVFTPVINADATLTLALPKNGLRKDTTKPMIGELYLGDISVPPELYSKDSLGIELGPIFSENSILRLS